MTDRPKITMRFFLLFMFCMACGNIAHAGDSDARDNVWSFNIGPNAKNWGYVGLTRDYPVNDNFSLFVTGGLGTILIGGGAAYYANAYYEDSLVLSATVGLLGAHADLAYQWKLRQKDFLTLGASYGVYFMQYQGFLAVASYEFRF